jgi:sugar lactone lactonase YvrE
VSKEGKLLGMIPIAEFASNVTFGGTDGMTLYITCDKKVYSLAMQVKGAQSKY